MNTCRCCGTLFETTSCVKVYCLSCRLNRLSKLTAEFINKSGNIKMKIVTCSNCRAQGYAHNIDTICRCRMCGFVTSVNEPVKPFDFTERNELAKEIMLLLMVDLIKHAHEVNLSREKLNAIVEANVETAFLHADLFMKQKALNV